MPIALTDDQKSFFEENGYLPYDRVLADETLQALRQRCEDIAEGRLDHLPSRFIQFESSFRDSELGDTPRLDAIRKMTHLTYFDDLFDSVARSTAIVDVIEDLIGPDIKIYTDQLMMKPRFNGTVTGWHQDSVAWPFFVPQDHVSCWVALDDATVDNGCMNVIPGSHKWGSIGAEYVKRMLADAETPAPVPVELKAGSCMFHHGLNFHQTGANTTPNRRRGLALHYIKSTVKYLGIENEEHRLLIEAERPRGEFRFKLIRGMEYDGRA